MTESARGEGALPAPGIPVFRIFISSPGDVAEERSLAERVLQRLREELAAWLAIEGIIWEHEPLLATETFQSQLRSPSESDVVVAILWARLGTRLPANFIRPDGSRYDSGTEFEFEDAVEGFRRRGVPELLVYRKTAEPVVSLRDPAVAMAKLEQKRMLDAFVERWFHDRTEGTLVAAFHPFDSAARFEELLDTHLRKLIARRYPRALTARTAAGVWRHGSPFRGLSVFDPEHAPIFFGRTRESAEVMHALRMRAAKASAFVMILGMSGSGKSSLARAGVVPLLTQTGVVAGIRTWRSAVTSPAECPGEPLESLVRGCERARGAEAGTTAIASTVTRLRADPAGAANILLGDVAPDSAMVLVIDQMEELFTRPAREPDDARAFVAAISALAVSGRVWVIATLRSDYYAQCEALPELVALKEGEGQYHLLPPSPAQIADMVAGPARMAGLRFEEDAATGEHLEQRLVDAASASPEGLPLLEFTLEELYKRRTQDGVLTLEAYRALGGVEGALATRAEEVWTTLQAATREALSSVLRALVDASPRDRDIATRRSAPLAQFTPAARALIDAFVQARLFSADRDDAGRAMVTIAHEALLRHWPRVTDWVRDNGEFLRMRARLANATALWQEEGEASERLLPPGKPLADAMELDSRFGGELPADLRRFVQLSQDAQERARRARRRRTAGVVGTVLLATTAFGAFSSIQWRRTENARRQVALQRAEALRASESLLTNSLELGFPTGVLRKEQLTQLREVLERLVAVGHRDTVELIVHPGRFRVVDRAGSVRLRTASDDCARVTCREFPSATEESRLVETVTASVRDNVLRDVAGVAVRIRGMPATEPWDPYPAEDATPSEWNDAARRNHRLIVLLAGG